MRGVHAWCIFLLIGSARWVGAEPLTEREAVQQALSHPAVRDVLEGESQAAEGATRGTGLWPNPVLSYTREQTFEDPAGASEDVVALSQTFDLSGRRGLRSDAARLRARSSSSRMTSWTWDLEAEVRHRFYAVLLGQGRVGAARDLTRRLSDLSQVMARREGAGDVSSYDRKRVEREHATAKSVLYAEETTLYETWAMLAALIGSNGSDGADAQVVVGEMLPTSEPEPVDSLLDSLKDTPPIRTLEQEANALDLEARAARRGWVPDLTIIGGYKTAAPGTGRFHGYVVGASIPLPFVDRDQGKAQSSEARALSVRGRLTLERTRVAGEVRGLWRRTSRLTAAAQRYRAEAVVRALDLVEIAEAAYAGGELGVLELLDAHRGLYEARSRTLDLQWKAREARIELDRLTGGTQ